MIINQKPHELFEFLSDAKNWPLFLDFYYYQDGLLDIRSVTGSKRVNFAVEGDQENPSIFISNNSLKFKYQFNIHQALEGSEVTLTTDYIIPFLESRTLKLMGINLMPKSETVLDNIQHFVDFGHIH
jgi:hypothetical protein